MKDQIFDFAGFKEVIDSSMPYKLIDDIFYILVLLALGVLFYLGYKKVKSEEVDYGQIIKWSVLYGLLMSLAIPNNSSDIFGYIARGAQQTLYDQNPYLQTVNSIEGFKGFCIFCNFMWTSTPTTYGPVFIYFSKIILLLSENNLFISLLNFKLLNYVVFLVMLYFLLKLEKKEDIYLIAFNPLILIHGLWNGHNDLLCGGCIFVGAYLLSKQKYFSGTFWLVFAAGIKYISLLVIPLIFAYLIKENKIQKNLLHTILGICSGVLLISIFSIDYLVGFNNLDSSSADKLIGSVGLVHQSFCAMVFTLIRYLSNWLDLGFDLDFVKHYLKYIFYTAFFVFYAVVLLDRKKPDLILDIAKTLLFFIAFTLPKFHSWYLLNVIILIPLLKDGVVRGLLKIFSVTHAFSITFLDQAKILNFLSMTLAPTIAVFKRGK